MAHAADEGGDGYEPVVHRDQNAGEGDREHDPGEVREKGGEPSHHQRGHPRAAKPVADTRERVAGTRGPRHVATRGEKEAGEGQYDRLDRGEDRYEYADRNYHAAGGTYDRLDDVREGRLRAQELPEIGGGEDHGTQRHKLEEDGYECRNHHPPAYLLRLALRFL